MVPQAMSRLGGTQSVPGNANPPQEENTMTSDPSLSDLHPLDDRFLYMSAHKWG
jgi:hypothetical protein